jgi:hypothetical protein
VPEQLTDAGNIADFADVRVDINGGRHLVWYDANVDAVFYRMSDQSGNVLIDTMQINNAGSGGSGTRPALAIDSASRLLVVWQNGVDQEIYFLRLEPYLDDLDGSPADLTLIRTVADTRISDDLDGLAAVHPRVAVDGTDDLHIVWEDDCGPNVQYVRVDSNDGSWLNGPELLGGGGSCNDRPDIAIDSANNAHIVFSNTGNTQAEEVYYALINGAAVNDAVDDSMLIDSTLLTVDDGLRATRATLGVERGDDIAYVVYTASTAAGGEEIIMAALNPSLDDRDGSVADPAAIRLSETVVSPGNPQLAWRAFSRFGSDRRMHVIYTDFDATTCQGAGAGGLLDIIHVHITTAGKVIARETLTAAGATSATTCDPEARMAPGGNRIVWAQSTVTGQEIFSDTFARADAGESGFTCSLGPAGSAWRAGDFWLLLVGLVALGVWCRRVPG